MSSGMRTGTATPQLAQTIEWLDLPKLAKGRVETLIARLGEGGIAALEDVLGAAACGLGSWQDAGRWLWSPAPSTKHSPLDVFCDDPGSLGAFRLRVVEELYRIDAARRVLRNC